MKLSPLLTFLVIVPLITSTVSMANGRTKVIYGEDNRHNVENYPDREFRELSKSVAGMVKSYSLKTDPDNSSLFNFPKVTYSEELSLCSEERFKSEFILPTCTGFLVASDILVTAGHCITNESDCNNYSWVFDYKNGTEKIAKKNVYKCKEIIKRDLKSSKFSMKDYAVIRLDRPTKRKALSFRKKGRPFAGTKLVVIGHPAGLPLKIADGAKVKFANIREILRPISSLFRKRNYFIANLDTYAGNSGSPVFNLKKGRVEGILVQGANDFVRDYNRFCTLSARRSNSALKTREVVFRITKIPGLEELISTENK